MSDGLMNLDKWYAVLILAQLCLLVIGWHLQIKKLGGDINDAY
jgi:hypothetical protein